MDVNVHKWGDAGEMIARDIYFSDPETYKNRAFIDRRSLDVYVIVASGGMAGFDPKAERTELAVEQMGDSVVEVPMGNYRAGMTDMDKETEFGEWLGAVTTAGRAD